MKKLFTQAAIIISVCCTLAFNTKANIDTVQVGAGGDMFSPSDFNVCLGDTIRFEWQSGFHNVHILTPVDSVSADLTTAGDAFNYVPTIPGNYTFQCDYHFAGGMTGTFTVYNSPSVTFSSITNVTCNGGSNGAVNINVSGGSSPYAYLWSSGDTTQDINNIMAGTYDVTVSDTNGCGKIKTYNVTEPAAIVIDSVHTINDNCNGSSNGSATVYISGGTAPYFHLWSNGANTATASNLSAGTYTDTITDAKGCSIDTTIDITEPPIPAFTTSQTDLLCNGDSNATASILGLTAPITHSINISNFAFTPNSITANVGDTIKWVLVSGTHTTTSTSVPSGASTWNSGTMSTAGQTFKYVVTKVGTYNYKCNFHGSMIGTITVSAQPYTYSWNTTPVQTTSTATGLKVGDHIATVTKSSSGCSFDTTFTITQPAAVSIDSILVTNALCFGDSGIADAYASGGTGILNYNWSNGATTPTMSDTAGTYTLTVTDDNGCKDTASATIAEPVALSIDSFFVNDAPCYGSNGGAAEVFASGGTGTLHYNWSAGSNGSDTTLQAVGLTEGTYYVTVSDDNGCAAMDSTVVSGPTEIFSGLSYTDIACNDINYKGTASVNPSGGTSPYYIVWSASSTWHDNSIGGLNAGNQTVTISDNTGCQITDTFIITVPPAISLDSIVITDALCFGDSGIADAYISGGTGALHYNWSNGDTTVAIVAPAGTYSLTVTDDNGCIKIYNSIAINEPSALSIDSFHVADVSCNGGNNGSAEVYVSGGTSSTGGYYYDWSTGDTTYFAANLTAGTYFVTVSDDNGCGDTSSVIVSEPAELTAVMSSTDPTSGTNNDGTATATPSGGTTAYTYLWSNSGTTQTISNLTPGSYIVTVTDTNGCTHIDSAYVNSFGCNLVNSITPSDVTCFGGNNGFATVNTTGGITPYTYAWNNGQTGQTDTALTAGTYTVTVTDSTGTCKKSSTVTISQSTAVLIFVSVTNTNCTDTFNVCNGKFSASASGGSGGGYSFSWSNGLGTGSSINQVCVGTYTVTATDFNGCTGTASVTMNALHQSPSATLSASKLNCTTMCDGTGTVTVSGGNTPYSYSWTTGSDFTQTSNQLCVGNNSVTVTDVNGCRAKASATLTQPISNVAATAVVVKNACNTMCTGEATVSTTSGGTTPYMYSWSTNNPSSTSPDYSGLCVGVATVTVTDAHFCQATSSATIGSYIPAVSISQTNVSCFGGNNGSAALTVSGGYTPYSFNWGNGDTTATASGLSPQNYFISINDANNCHADTNVNITQPPNGLNNIFTSMQQVSCYGGNDGSVTDSAVGGTSPYTYSWSNGATGATVTGLTAGTYDGTATDANGCTKATGPFTITEPSQIIISVTTNNVSCAGGNDGSASASATGGSSSPGFTWSTGASAGSIGNLTAGPYSVTATDFNNCSADTAFVITEPQALSVSTMTTDETAVGANDGTAMAMESGGTSPYTYSWSNGGTSASLSALSPGTYSVTVTDANGCSATGSATVNAFVCNLSVAMSATGETSVGAGDGTAMATASAGTSPYTYSWSNSGTTMSISNLEGGTYTVTVTDSSGCKVIDSVTVNPWACNLSVTIATTNETSTGANDGTASSIVTGGTSPYTYSWNNGKTTTTITGLSPGLYHVNVTDSKGCTVQSNNGVVNAAGCTMTIDAVVISQILCAGGSNGTAKVNITNGTAPYSYQWFNGDSTATVSNLSAGTYKVGVKDANGCIALDSVTLTNPPAITMSVNHFDASCNGGTGTASVSASGGSGGLSILWSNGATSATLSGLSAGNYSVTVTDTNGCNNFESFTISQPSAIVPSVSSTDETASGANDGTATASANGGTPGYTYSWSNSATTSSVSNLAPATYTVSVTDANGCTATANAIINPFGCTLVLDSVTTTDVSCNGGSNGAATAYVSGGTTPLTYVWSSGGNAAMEDSLSAGNYSVTITDNGGCGKIGTATISQPTLLTASVTTTNETSFGAHDGTATATASGGTSPYNYLWGNGANTQTITVLFAPGVYCVTVSDANGCANGAFCGTVNAYTCNMTVSASSTNETSFGGNNGTATVTASGGTTAYTYLWSNGGTSASLSALSPGTYHVTVTDSKNCTVVDSATVNEFICNMSITVSTTDETSAGANDGTATATPSGGTSPYSYLWDNGGNGDPINGLVPGTYCVTVTDSKNCIVTACDTVNAFVCNMSVSLASTSETFFGANNGTDTANVTGGNFPYNFTWSNGGNNFSVISLLAPGNYCVTVTDANGCMDSACNSVGAYVCTLSATATHTNETVAGANDGSATLTASGGTTPYTYLWSNGKTTANITGLAPGTYHVTVTDSKNCVDTASVIILAGPGGVNEITENISLSMYPNPVKENLFITVSMRTPERITVEVRNNLGQIVQTLMSERTSLYKTVISTEKWSAGVYFISVKSSQAVKTEKIIVE